MNHTLLRLLSIAAIFACSTNIVFAAGQDTIINKPGNISFSEMIPKNLREGKRVAVLIGISEYTSPDSSGFSKIEGSQNDIGKMKDFLLLKAGFDTIYMVTEDRATKDRIERLMVDEVPSKLGPKDKLLFYWSGHGIARKAGDRTIGYLPLSTSRRNLYSTMISMDDIVRWDELLPVQQSLYVIDACLSGLAGIQTKASDQSLRLEQIDRPSRHLFSAGTGDELAIVGPRWGGSLFTDAFIQGASGAALRDNGSVISISDILTYVRRTVATEKEKVGWSRSISPQLRQIHPSDGEFFFLRAENRTPNDVVAGAANIPVGKKGEAPADESSSRSASKSFAKLTSEEESEIQGLRFDIIYSDARDVEAIAIEKELVRIGAKVDLVPRDTHPTDTATDTIYYEKGRHLNAAKATIKLLKNFGYKTNKSKNVGVGTDILIYLQ